MHRGGRRVQVIGGLLLVVVLLLAACGGRGRGGDSGESGTSGRAEPAVPTMPAAQFAQPTTMITVAPSDAVTATAPAEVASTEVATATTATETPSAATATPAATGGELTAQQARGQELYTTRKCGQCHGANAEGVPDKGSAVAGTTLSLEAFTDLIRTGGEIGPDHLFGPMTISPSGVTAIHAWLQALPAE